MSFLKPKSIDATEGPLLGKIILYSIPLVISVLIQQMFNAVDIMVLSNMAGPSSVASVSSTGSITALLVNTFVGVSSGARVVLARQIGAKQKKDIRETTDTSLITSVTLGIFIAVLGFLVAPWFLDITNCPTECYDGALVYVRIYLCAAPFILFYNFGSAVITAGGDTQRPLYYIMIGGVANVVLNIILCLILPQKVMAVAIATVTSNVIGALLVFSRLLTMDGDCKVSPAKMRFKPHALGTIMRFGLPSALTHALFPISNLQIQSAINSYGVMATAGNGAATTLEHILSAFSGPISTTAATFIGQNIGAKKPQRVKKVFSQCMTIGILTGTVMGVLFYVCGPFLLSFFVGGDSLAIEFGMIRMFCTTLFYAIATANNVYGSAMQAHGYSLYSAINSIFCVLIFRFIWMQLFYPFVQTFFFVVVCFVVSWAVRLVVNVILYHFVMKKYKRKTEGIINEC